MAFEAPREKIDTTLPESPGTCPCGNTPVLLSLTVVDRSGRLKTGAASEFVGRDNHNNPNWSLTDRWSFDHWNAYCADCTLPKPKEPSKYSEDQVAFAWRWFLGEVLSESETLGGAIKRVHLPPEKRDTAIEIVNYEAWRLNQPDAIPDGYRIREVWQ